MFVMYEINFMTQDKKECKIWFFKIKFYGL